MKEITLLIVGWTTSDFVTKLDLKHWQWAATEKNNIGKKIWIEHENLQCERNHWYFVFVFLFVFSYVLVLHWPKIGHYTLSLINTLKIKNWHYKPLMPDGSGDLGHSTCWATRNSTAMILQRGFCISKRQLVSGEQRKFCILLSFVVLPNVWLHDVHFTMSNGCVFHRREGKMFQLWKSGLKNCPFVLNLQRWQHVFGAWYKNAAAARTSERNKAAHPERSLVFRVWLRLETETDGRAWRALPGKHFEMLANRALPLWPDLSASPPRVSPSSSRLRYLAEVAGRRRAPAAADSPPIELHI